MVPTWLINEKPPARALDAYVNLGKRGTWNPGAGTYDECRPSLPTLAEDMGVSESTARRALDWLIAKGAVTKRLRFDETGAPLPSIYRVVLGVLSKPDAPRKQAKPTSKKGGGGVTSGTTPGVTDGTRVVSPVTGNQEPNTKNPKTQRKTSSLTGAASVTDPCETGSQSKIVRETSPPPKIKGVSNTASTVLGRSSIVIDDIPAVAREIIRLNSVTGDGWWIAAEKNGSLDDRIHEAVRAIERVAESKLAREAAATLGGMKAPRSAAPVAAPPYAKNWRQHPGCEWGYVGHKRCPACVAETQTMAAAS